jgi:hypothetical protein
MLPWLFAGAVFCCLQRGLVRAQANVDLVEPILIRSPARGDPEDGFGWAAILHQVEQASSSDSIDEAIRKTRYCVCSVYVCACCTS